MDRGDLPSVVHNMTNITGSYHLQTRMIQTLGLITFILSITFNLICINLLLVRAKLILRKYKNLLVIFCVVDTLFSLFYLLSGPVHLISDTTVMLVSRGPLSSHPTLGYLSILGFICEFSFCAYLLTVLFIYRFIHICAPHCMFIFERRTTWMVIVIFFFVVGFGYGTMAHFCSDYQKNREVEDLHMIDEEFGEIDHPVAYLALKYYEWDSEQDNGTTPTNGHVTGFYMGAISGSIAGLIASLTIILYCSSRVLYDIKHVPMSATTRNMHMHLLKALLVQTLIPVIFCYTPILCTMLSPLLKSSVWAYVKYVLLLLGWYPVIDPLLITYFVIDYRETARSIVYAIKRSRRVRAATYTENSY